MVRPTFFDNVREWLGGIAFDIFLWSARMTQDEYLDAVVRESELTPLALDGATVCRKISHLYIDGVCAECGSPEPPRQ